MDTLGKARRRDGQSWSVPSRLAPPWPWVWMPSPPKGSGSVARGQQVWEGKCASCHGIFGESNEVFSPPAAEVDRAKRILVALDEAAREGRGAAQLDGRMIDAASARMAQVVVEIAEAVAKRSR